MALPTAASVVSSGLGGYPTVFYDRVALDTLQSNLFMYPACDLKTMPDMNGVEAIIAICGEFPEARIIVLTTYKGDIQVLRALKAGARAYLLKGLLRKELLETIRAVHAGQKRIPPEVAAELADHAIDDALTSREIDVLRLIAGGNANKLVADRLSITEETVKGHVKNILSKLGASDRTHAVTIALKRGIIDL